MGIEDAFLTELVHDFRKQLGGEHTDFIEVVSCLVANKESDSSVVLNKIKAIAGIEISLTVGGVAVVDEGESHG